MVNKSLLLNSQTSLIIIVTSIKLYYHIQMEAKPQSPSEYPLRKPRTWIRSTFGMGAALFLTLLMAYQINHCHGEACMFPPMYSLGGYLLYSWFQVMIPLSVSKASGIFILAVLNLPIYYLFGWATGWIVQQGLELQLSLIRCQFKIISCIISEKRRVASLLRFQRKLNRIAVGPLEFAFRILQQDLMRLKNSPGEVARLESEEVLNGYTFDRTLLQLNRHQTFRAFKFSKQPTN